MPAARHHRDRRTVAAPAAGAWLKRLLLQLTRQAARDAARIPRWPDTAVHSLRKRMKKLQSLLRLVPRATDHDALISLRCAIRHLKGTVSAQRDADVLAALGRQLGTRPPRSRRLPQQTGQVGALVQSVLCHVETLDLDALTWTDIAGGYLKTCRRARRAWKHAQQDPSVEALHKWRMRVKDHYHQSLALHPWIGSPKRLRRARRLGSLLGRCHDLDLFATTLSGKGARAKRRLRDKVAARRAKLTRRIFDRAEKVFGWSAPALARQVTVSLPLTVR